MPLAGKTWFHVLEAVERVRVHVTIPCQEQAQFRSRNAERRRTLQRQRRLPAIIAPGRVPGKGRSACLGDFPSATCMLLKPSRKEKSVCPGVVAFNDYVKGTEELLRRRQDKIRDTRGTRAYFGPRPLINTSRPLINDVNGERERMCVFCKKLFSQRTTA